MNRLLLSALLPTFVIVMGPSCASAPVPCATSGVCGEGRLCVAGACRPKNQIPAETTARKLELWPDRWAVLASRGPEPWNGVDVPFGRSSAGTVALLLHFNSPLREASRVVSAFLVLDAMPDMPPSSSPVPLNLSRISAPWSAETATWARLPALSPLHATVLASNWGGRRLFVDVSSEVHRWREQRDDQHGIALVAEPHDPIGASYSLGLAGAQGPRLEIYLR